MPKHIAMFTLIFVHLSEYLYELYHVEKLLRRDMELDRMLEFVRYAHPTKLGNYSGRNVDYILRLLYDDDDAASTSQDNTSLLTSSAADTTHLEPDDEQESTRNIAHGLHFASIAMLGLLVLEVSRHFSLVT